jgi:hypothetical protein
MMLRSGLRRALLLLLGLAAGATHAACESGLAERMHAKLYPDRSLDERLAACKPWPAFPGRSIVVLPVPQEVSSSGAKVFDLELLLIQRPDNGNTDRDTVVARIRQPEALDEDSATAIQDIRIDTSRYVLSSDTRAFGLRVRYRGTTPGNSTAIETLRLYVQQGSKLRQVLPEIELDHDSGEWDQSCSGRFEKLRTMLSVAPSTSNGWHDLQLSRTRTRSRALWRDDDQNCTLVALPARLDTLTLRYDGERYRVPKSLRDPVP